MKKPKLQNWYEMHTWIDFVSYCKTTGTKKTKHNWEIFLAGASSGVDFVKD